jgi:hypothetical protein
MKKPEATTYLIAALVICVIATVIGVSTGGVKAETPQTQNDANDADATAQAIRRGGLKEIARIKKHYTGIFDPNYDLINFDIESLARYSAAVVTGRPTASKSQLSANGLLVITEYEIAIQEVIKGVPPPNYTVKITVPGGKVEFEDGTSAELLTPGFGNLTIGVSYLLFLHPRRDGDDTYSLTAGPQGLIELPTDGGHVKTYGRSTDAVVKETKDDNVRSLLEKVHKATEKWPQPATCCS